MISYHANPVQVFSSGSQSSCPNYTNQATKVTQPSTKTLVTKLVRNLIQPDESNYSTHTENLFSDRELTTVEKCGIVAVGFLALIPLSIVAKAVMYG